MMEAVIFDWAGTTVVNTPPRDGHFNRPSQTP